MVAGALLLGALCLGGGIWLGQRQARLNQGIGTPRQALEGQLQALQQQIAAGEAGVDEQQRLLELLLGLGRKAEAAALLEQLADRQPQRWGLRLLLAELRRDLGDRSAASRELRQLLNQRPDQIEALQLLALLLLEQGQGTEARQRVQASFERQSKPQVRPESLATGLLLAELLSRQGSPGQAEAVLVRLATAFPRDQRPLLARALLKQQRGDLKGAQASLAQARNLRPGTPDPRLDQIAAVWGLASLRAPSRPGKEPRPADSGSP
jgi:tetratricopeptide (TPR) repeat protein